MEIFKSGGWKMAGMGARRWDLSPWLSRKVRTSGGDEKMARVEFVMSGGDEKWPELRFKSKVEQWCDLNPKVEQKSQRAEI